MGKNSIKEATPNRSVYFNQLDGLRCMAVMAVLVCHWITYRFFVLIPFGSMGVNLFFVLSGFLITRILFITKDENQTKEFWHPIKRFYIRRSLRIFPIYFLTIFFLAAINYHAIRANMIWLLTYTFNIKFSMPNVWESGELNFAAHLWSLSVEEQFYLFFPFLIFLIPRPKTKGFLFFMIALGILSRALLYFFDAPKNAIYVLTPACMDSFGIGALLAYYVLYDQTTLKKIIAKKRFFIIAILLFVFSIVYSRFYIDSYRECRTILERFLFSVCCFWIVGYGILSEYKGGVKWILENQFVIYIGKISYGLYIYHFFAEPFFFKICDVLKIDLTKVIGYNMISRSVFLFLATLIVASISWRLIEQPINKLKNKF